MSYVREFNQWIREQEEYVSLWVEKKRGEGSRVKRLDQLHTHEDIEKTIGIGQKTLGQFPAISSQWSEREIHATLTLPRKEKMEEMEKEASRVIIPDSNL